jgi:hypothetical protein
MQGVGIKFLCGSFTYNTPLYLIIVGAAIENTFCYLLGDQKYHEKIIDLKIKENNQVKYY